MLTKSIILSAAMTLAFAAPAFAGSGPSNKLHKLDYRLDRLEYQGVIKQGSYLDRVEDRIDRVEDKIDRREDKRDRAVNNGPLDRLEDKIDRRENRLDRRENKRDRRW